MSRSLYPSQVPAKCSSVPAQLASTMTPPLPSVLGSEAAGVIEGLGVGVNGPTIGMRVAAPLFAGGIYFGGYADYAVIDADLVTPLPDALPFEDATALLIQGLTALYLTR